MTILLQQVVKTPAGACPNCPLSSRMRVGARGNIESQLAILGEAPGGQELRNGIPFCGPSGQVLQQSLPLDWDFESLFVLNAIQCCPPKSSSQTKDKALKLQCVNACRQGVQDLLWAHPRKVILAMGNWAAVHILGDPNFKITKMRGEVDLIIDPIRGDTVQLVYAMHPASLLHGRGSATAFKQDVRTAIELTVGSEVMYGEGIRTIREQYLEPTFEVLETPEQVQALERRVREQNRTVDVAADLETHTFSAWHGRILCEGLYCDWDDNVAHIIPWRNVAADPEYARAVDALHALPNANWIWQNGKFDRRFLELDPHVQIIPEIDDDTLLLSYALDEASKAHDLEEQAKNYLGAPNYKDALKPWVPNMKASYENVPEDVLFDYLAKDVKNTLLIKEITREQVREDPALEKLYTRTLLPASKLLTRIELYGIMTDPAFVALNRDEILTDMDNAIDAIAEMAGHTINPNSPGEVASFLYDDQGLRIKGKRPTDTRKETLDKLPLHPAVKLIKGFRRSQKMLSTYVAAIEDRAINNVVHTTYKLHSTTTGRPASVEPNLLNIPREARYRRMYRSRDGMILIEGDYNTAELRGLAVLSGDVFLTGVFLDDKRNLHDEVSVEMYGPNFTPDQRIRAKAINFGIPYGRSAFSIAEEFDITPTEAQRLISTWFMRAPEAHAFIMKCRSAPVQGRTLVTPFGRKRRPGLVSQERLNGLQNEFANFFMQSIFSNDFAMHSCLRMENELLTEGAHIVNIPYDSVVVECPEDPVVVKRVAEIQRTYMEETPKLWIRTPIKFVVDMKCGTHWGLLKAMK